MTFTHIQLTQEGPVTVLTINRPQALNALTTDTLLEMERALSGIASDHGIAVLVITGKGTKAFVAGADIEEMAGFNPEAARRFSALGQRVFRQIETLPQPVIAAVNGYALGGGCELAMSCDLRIASERARFGQPEINLGIIPGYAGTQRLSKLIGIAKAKELIFTGELIKAMEAFSLGLVNAVVAPEDCLEATLEMARKIAQKGQLAVRYAKEALNHGHVDGLAGEHRENTLFALCFATQDQKEGMAAFLEKRQPKFKHC